MKLIIGLGNKDSEYALTRHNAGFLAIDALRTLCQTENPHAEGKFFSEISSGMFGQEKALFVKPLTYMNDSGKAVRALMDFYKLTPKDIVVIHDDLDIAPGTYRTTLSSRAAGHNGIKDIIEKLGTQDFFRIRIGIGRPVEVNGVCMSSHDFVLQNFSPAEQQVLTELFPKIHQEILNFLAKA